MAEHLAGRRQAAMSIEGRPIYSMLLPIPVVCFVGTLLTDISYLNSGGNLLWLEFSTWLNAAGLLFGTIAGVVLLIDTIRSSLSWAPFLLLLAALVVEFFSALVHSRDGWTAVAGAGLILSIVGAVLILISGWLWQPARYRDVAVQP